MSRRSQPVLVRHLGMRRHSGECSATPLIRAKPLTEKLRTARAKKSFGRHDYAAAFPGAAPAKLSIQANGLRLRYRHWSVLRHLLWPRSDWRKTDSFPCATPKSRACFKGCWCASNAVTPFIGVRREKDRSAISIIGAAVPTTASARKARLAHAG